VKLKSTLIIIIKRKNVVLLIEMSLELDMKKVFKNKMVIVFI
jgi:hypothetical protein